MVIKTNTTYLTLNALFVAMAIAVQAVGKALAIPAVSQGFVGPLINAILIISVLSTNLKYASMLAVITPITALLTLQLNPSMGFFVPFICIGNLIYVVLFSTIKVKVNRWILNGIKLTVASFGKYLFLSFSATKIITWINLGANENVVSKLAIMMGLPQLYTAFVGGIIAIIIYILISTKIKDSIEYYN